MPRVEEPTIAARGCGRLRYMVKSCVPVMSKWLTFHGGTSCRDGVYSYVAPAHGGGAFHVSPHCQRGRVNGYHVQFATVDHNTANRQVQQGKLTGLWHDVGRVRSPAQAATLIKTFCAAHDLKGVRRRRRR